MGNNTPYTRKHRHRPDIISAKEFRKILVDMGLALEKAEDPGETKSVTV